MKTGDITDILPFVRKPSSYLGGEKNSVSKEGTVDLFFALCFPDSYEIGTAHFGLQILYHLLNKHPQVAAERVFSPGMDMEACLRAEDHPIVSLETRKPLGGFDIVGFSLLYELNYTNILTLLDLAKIPFYASERSASYPLIVGGGPCTVNPEPLADFFDALVVGDGEETVMAMAKAWLDHKACGKEDDKASILNRWAEIDGVYIPSLFFVGYDKQGRQQLTPRLAGYASVSKAIVPELKKEDFPSAPVVPFGRPVHDRLRLEIARGCSRGCRFCQAGIIYRPVRERPTGDLLSLAETALAATGYEDVSFLSLSTGDYCNLNGLLTSFINHYNTRNIAVSIPSFRAGSLSSQDMAAIKKIRKTGFTIAPEAGSQRLRNVINKNITEDDILNTVETAFDMGWNLIKVYFMIGLPTETAEDIEQIIHLVQALKKLGKKKTGRTSGSKKYPQGRQTKRINVSVATFIPKPHTPFQWEPQVDLETARKKIFYLKDRLASRQIGFKWQTPEMSVLEGVFARGDRRLSRLLEAAYHKGCRFDGWSDCFNFDVWLEAAREGAIDFNFYTARTRKKEEPLPWDIVSVGASADFLKAERQRAYSEELTGDCRDGDCQNCGVCDFDGVKPSLFKPSASNSDDGPRQSPRPAVASSTGPVPTIRYAFNYSKTGRARYFGHLEFINLLIRAINRAKIPVVFSHGFHPKPKISFVSSLAVGIESEWETFYLIVDAPLDLQKAITDLNNQLPEGIKILDGRPAPKKKEPSTEQDTSPAIYRVVLAGGCFDPQHIEAFLSTDPFWLTVTDKKGNNRQVNLKEVVSRTSLIKENQLLLETRVLPGKKIRPAEIVRAVFSLEEQQLASARVIKVKPEESRS
jgi:radical SAM family uncharacterized protein/radical SAM-linked protein